ncbi:MAG: N-acetylornithine carbamoyltransferase [Phycisphaerae bacterium]|nr:N-acetylornithine carbamoyltransferase [Phycisphaerae bacterium]
MNHWLSFRDHSPTQLASLITLARGLKSREPAAVAAARSAIRDKILGLIFFNASLRTRVSFEAAMIRFGGQAICLDVGGSTWNLEHRDGAVMNADKAEHIKEAAPVLSRYCDALAVRTFAGLKNASEDAADALIRAFAKHSTVPLLNMESALEHPCQALADWMTVEERFGATRGRRFVLTWAPQAKAVPMAVPHSAALAAAAAGMHLTIAHPPGYDLNPAILDQARSWCAEHGTRFQITHEQLDACADAEVVYVKSWGSAALYGQTETQLEDFKRYAGWMVDTRHLRTPETILMHCLPVRRNVVISDAALDDPRCVVVDQAENRLWTQAAVLTRVFKQRTDSRGS